MPQSLEILIVKVKPEENKKLLEIGLQTFYNSFGPPVNTEENIRSYLQEKFTLAQIDRELQDDNSQFFFAKSDNNIIGYLKLNSGKAQTEIIEGKSLEIERIYVVKDYQGKKIGQLLLDKSIQIAKEMNIDFIWLGVWDKNSGAIKFYERNGFKTFDKHQFILGTEVQTDIMMKLEL
ncbi:GNAT family N-acetyltransferase [Aquimarina sp. MMG016]|uniref:GNAT family N-acetyltransferase n=1 Tax=Aquimarina sp. MMG016 TaxID=2822690 RepID=UPI001B3A2310|nr:GNAT family N-acetyltransferase [Aquimarina sp. MMG016]MBQ4819502.1 GNAT family N-acetyltransferase [Aquimarina sp. MMG016]